MDKYQHIVRWSVSSHYHREQFAVTRDINERKPIIVSYISGSATSYQDKDPSFEFVHMDKQTGLPVDIDTYHANIIEANKNDRADWKKHANFREYFGMPDLSPSSFM